MTSRRIRQVCRLVVPGAPWRGNYLADNCESVIRRAHKK